MGRCEKRTDQTVESDRIVMNLSFESDPTQCQRWMTFCNEFNYEPERIGTILDHAKIATKATLDGGPFEFEQALSIHLLSIFTRIKHVKAIASSGQTMAATATATTVEALE